MAIKNLISAVVPIAVGAGVASAKDKITESANQLVAGGWGGFRKMVAGGQDKVDTAAQYANEEAKLLRQGVPTQDVDEMIRQMSPPDTGTVLDGRQARLDVLAAIDADATAAQLKVSLQQDAEATSIEHKIKLVEKGVAIVVFDVMPEVVENRSVEYEAVAPPQYPSAFQKYKGTASTQWTIQATLTCRNIDGATENLRILNTLRGWTMPFFGDKTRQAYPKKLGAPPPVLEFSGFKDQMIGPVQVVITALNWNFPQDVDYIPARGFDVDTTTPGAELKANGQLIPFPTVIKLQISLVESFSTDQINGFDLAAFRVGQFDKSYAQTLSLGMKEERTKMQVNRGSAPVSPEAQVVSPSGASSGTQFISNDLAEFTPVTEAVDLGDADAFPSSTVTEVVVEGTPPPPSPMKKALLLEIGEIRGAISQTQERFDRLMLEYATEQAAGREGRAAIKKLQADEARSELDALEIGLLDATQRYEAL